MARPGRPAVSIDWPRLSCRGSSERLSILPALRRHVRRRPITPCSRPLAAAGPATAALGGERSFPLQWTSDACAPGVIRHGEQRGAEGAVGLRVIGSGLGRTGTMSLKLALEQLGLGPCHHMKEVLDHPESVPLWIDAFEGRPDWDAIFENYNSAIDAPGCRFWRELSEHYPEAKVLH